MQNKLTKFILKSALFLLPIAAFCTAVYVAFAKFPMYFFDGEYAMYQQQKDYIYNNDDYNRVIITGDSKAKAAYLPKILSDDTYNLSLGGTSPVENYYYLKEYFENHKIPETVIISYTPDHYMDVGTFWTKSIYFHRINQADVNDIYNTICTTNFFEGIISDSNKFCKELLEYKFYSVKKYAKPLMKSLLEDRHLNNDNIYCNMYKTKGQVYFGSLEYSNDISREAEVTIFKPLDIIDYYFRKTIDMCLNFDINVIIEVVPMNKATYEKCSQNYLIGYSNYMKEIQSEYHKIIVNVDLYYYDNEYFGDAAHVNSKGAEKYSQYIKEKYPEVFEK